MEGSVAKPGASTNAGTIGAKGNVSNTQVKVKINVGLHRTDEPIPLTEVSGEVRFSDYPGLTHEQVRNLADMWLAQRGYTSSEINTNEEGITYSFSAIPADVLSDVSGYTGAREGRIQPRAK